MYRLCFLVLMLFSLLVCSCSDESKVEIDGDLDNEANFENDPEAEELIESEQEEENDKEAEIETDSEYDLEDESEDSGFDPTFYVDPFIGTSGDSGQLSPAAGYPFGMVLLGADSIIPNHAGYNYQITPIRGFSHTRINGVGCNGTGGDLLVLPLLQNKKISSLKTDKSTEAAEAGYFAVSVGENAEIRAEMTVSQHSGMHRYTFPDKHYYLQIDFETSIAGRVDKEWNLSLDDNEINGWFESRNVCNKGKYKLFFSMKFNRDFSLADSESKNDDKFAILDFGEQDDKTLLIKVGLSSVDIESAREDRDLEIPSWDFDDVRVKARKAWQSHLSAIEIEADEELNRLFYSMLYRTMHTPANITTNSGKYRGTDGLVHQADGYRHHHGWSLWDTYRNKFALITLLDKHRSGEIMQSLVDLYNQGKVDWSTDNEPYPNVRTEHAAAILLDAWRKGVNGFNLEDAFDAIVTEAETLPVDSADKQLETSYDRWVVAQIAAIVEDQQTYQTYLDLSAQYKDLWLDTFKTMGDDADVMHAQGLYEGTLWQYRWAAVHDIYGMIELDGKEETFKEKLNYYFDNELHNHANEPDIHAPFLFNYVGEAEKTQDMVRRLLIEKVNQWYGTHEKWEEPYTGRIYKAEPEGFVPEMDDDDGTMSAWFVLAALGIYPVTIGQPVYALTAPLFEKAVLHLKNNTDFIIRAKGVSGEKRYIQSATLNGEALNRAWLNHSEIAEGGELVFIMGKEPNVKWGNAAENLPPNAFE